MRSAETVRQFLVMNAPRLAHLRRALFFCQVGPAAAIDSILLGLR